jgi:hypothetical protein
MVAMSVHVTAAIRFGVNDMSYRQCYLLMKMMTLLT